MLPYVLPDPVLAKKLEEVGCATVMPLAAPIGSGRGLKLRDAIRIMIEQAEVPVVVDAGLGAPSQAAEAMEMGADAVLVNTAIAHAADPVAMARAFALAVEAGRAGVPRRRHGGARDRAAVQPDLGARDPAVSAMHRQRPRARARARRDGRAAARAPRARRPLRARRAKRRAGRARRVRRHAAGRGRHARRRAPGGRRMTFADRRLYLVTGVRPGPRRLPRGRGARRRGRRPDPRARPARRRAAPGARTRRGRSRTGSAVPLVVNDRPDLAALVGADAVHVGQDDLPVRERAQLRRPGRALDARARRRSTRPRRTTSASAPSTRRRRRRAGRRSGSTSSATPPSTRRSPGSRSAASTARTSSPSSPPAPRASRSCARSATPPTRGARRGSSARRS